MLIKRLYNVRRVLVCLGITVSVVLNAFAQPAASDSPLLPGNWAGQVHYGTETKQMALRIEEDAAKKSINVFLYIPDVKFYNLALGPVKLEGEEYKSAAYSFRLSPDKKSLIGKLSFDGHELPFELESGALPGKPERTPPTGRIAQPAWTYKTGDAIWSSPVIANNLVYFGSNDGFVYALNAESGQLVWQYRTKGRVVGQPTVSGSYLYILSDDGNLYKLERKSGKFVWQFDTGGGSVPRDFPSLKSPTYDRSTSAATVVGETVYIGSADKRLYAVDTETGKEKWHFETGGIVRPTPAVADGLVFFGSYDNHVYAVDAKSGELRWKHNTLQAVVSSPLVADGVVYIGSRSSDLFAFDALTGKIKWKFFYWSSWVESSARMLDRVLYVGSSDYQQLFAIDAVSGRKVWNVNIDGSAWSTPAVTDSLVYIGAVGTPEYLFDHHGGFFAVDRLTGKVNWHFPMNMPPDKGNYGVASSPAVGQKLVYFGGLDGVFYAFRING